jgi:hypothetical protein
VLEVRFGGLCKAFIAEMTAVRRQGRPVVQRTSAYVSIVSTSKPPYGAGHS